MNADWMYEDLVTMLKDMNQSGKNGKPYVEDLVFKTDGYAVCVILSNGNQYSFCL